MCVCVCCAFSCSLGLCYWKAPSFSSTSIYWCLISQGSCTSGSERSNLHQWGTQWPEENGQSWRLVPVQSQGQFSLKIGGKWSSGCVWQRLLLQKHCGAPQTASFPQLSDEGHGSVASAPFLPFSIMLWSLLVTGWLSKHMARFRDWTAFQHHDVLLLLGELCHRLEMIVPTRGTLNAGP